MTLRQNEVVAVTGLVGAGKSALAGALYGLALPVAGDMALDGRPYRPTRPGEAVAAGVFLAARDRLTNAVIPAFDIRQNLTLPFTTRHAGPLGLMRRAAERAAAVRTIDAMGVVCQGPLDGILTLSGGNQQKVVVGRWMAEASRLLILDEPFQGVDIQARRDIARRIRASADTRATLVLCSEIDEAMEVADRILVMVEHTLVGEHRNDAVDLDRLMAEVAGADLRKVPA
jgi:simple sugar transport system ATP-binding protein